MAPKRYVRASYCLWLFAAAWVLQGKLLLGETAKLSSKPCIAFGHCAAWSTYMAVSTLVLRLHVCVSLEPRSALIAAEPLAEGELLVPLAFRCSPGFAREAPAG